MRTRAPLIVLALLTAAAVLFCFQACGRKPVAIDEAVPEEAPAVASHRSFWLNAVHHSACQVEDSHIRDELLLRLLPYCLRARDTALEFQILEKVESDSRKASAHVESAVAARQSNDMATYRKNMDTAIQIADATFARDEDGYIDGDASIYRDIGSTLIESGYFEDAVSITLPICESDLSHRTEWLDWFHEVVLERARSGNIADAKYIANAIPSQHGTTRAYIGIARIQHDDGHASDATRTLQEAIPHVRQLRRVVSKPYCLSLIAAAFAQNGDNTNAIDARTRCHQALTAVDTSQLQTPSDDQWDFDSATVAQTYAELARTSSLLEEPEEARRLLAQADSIAKIDDDSGNEAVADIAEIWMCMNEQDSALAIADAQQDPYSKAIVLNSVISHPSFSATKEVTDQIDRIDSTDRFWADLVLCNLVGHHLRHERVAQAQMLAETIREEMYRDDAYGAIIKKHCELGSIEQAIDIAATISDISYRNHYYSIIIKKHCELGSIERAIDIAAGIDDPWTELDVFQMVGKSLAKSRSIAELESFLTAQTKPTKLSAAYLGVLEVLVTDAEANDRLQTDGDSAVPPPDQ